MPYSGPLPTILDNMEQLYRKLIYSRLKAVEAYLEPEVKERTIHLESKPEDFFYNMLRVDKMKEGLFEGYYQTLKYSAENYVMMNDRLRRGGLCLIPRTEIFRLVTKSSTVRERAYIIKEQRLERGSFRRRLGSALTGALGRGGRRRAGARAGGVPALARGDVLEGLASLLLPSDLEVASVVAPRQPHQDAPSRGAGAIWLRGASAHRPIPPAGRGAGPVGPRCSAPPRASGGSLAGGVPGRPLPGASE